MVQTPTPPTSVEQRANGIHQQQGTSSSSSSSSSSSNTAHVNVNDSGKGDYHKGTAPQAADKDKNKNTESEDDRRRSSAVALLQERYRGYRSRRERAGLNLELPSSALSSRKDSKGKEKSKDDGNKDSQGREDDGGGDNSHNSPISPNSRWNEAITSGGLHSHSKDQHANKNDPKSRWQRSGFYAERITGTDGRQSKGVQETDQDGSQSTEAKAAALAPNKQMEAQYWLELVDSKHRYGTNLKSYHEAWNKSSTRSNFFYWLDNGSGKDLDLPDCPRSQLDKERVTYLSAEQRKNYLVDVGKDGMLYWRRNGRKVDTAKGKWEDLGNGRGVGYKGEKDNLPPPSKEEEEEAAGTSSSSSSSSMYSSSDSEAEHENRDPFKEKHYHQQRDEGESKRHYLTSPKVVMDILLRKTINSNTWIYVSDTSGRLFVGIKSTGGFQHSSFMYGATVASAGLLKAKNGQLTSLSPLSGHYRAGTVHFKAFCKSLEEKGVDVSRVSISKSLFVIGGIEKYGRFSKKKQSLKARLREKLHLGPSNEQKKDREDEKRNEKIEEKAQEKHGIDEKHGPPSQQQRQKGTTGTRRSGNSDCDDDIQADGDDKDDVISPDMHEDIKKEDLTDKQRAERAIALIRSAMSKGLKGEKQQVLEAGEPEQESQQQQNAETDEEQEKEKDAERPKE